MNKIILNKLIKLSNKALKKGEISVAAVIVKDDKIISCAYNKRQHKYDVTGHAEIIAIRKAEKKIKDWRLDGYDMYVTLQPCDMCEEVIKESRLDNCYYLINKPKTKESSKNNIVYYQQTNDINELLEIFQKSFKKLR